MIEGLAGSGVLVDYRAKDGMAATPPEAGGGNVLPLPVGVETASHTKGAMFSS